MRTQCLYAPSDFELGASLTLSEDQAHHFRKVLRGRVGDEVILLNGQGVRARGRVQEISNEVLLEIIQVERQVKRSQVTLCFGTPKRPAAEFIVHRCTELGVSAFQPIETDHCEAKGWNTERFQKVVTEVAKQCQQPHFPQLCEPCSFDDFLKATKDKVVVVCDENQRDAELSSLPEAPCYLLIGPEGGWSERERQKLRAADVLFLGLGANRLRTETACLAAAVLIKKLAREL